MVEAFADLKDLPEENQIALIAASARTQVVGVFVDDEAAAERYQRKVVAEGAGVRVLSAHPTSVGTTWLIQFGPAHAGQL